MAPARNRLQALYGASGLHLLLMLATFALGAYIVLELGIDELWNPDVWWQSILVWFLGAVLLHDLVLFPLYALADRLTGTATRRRTPPDHTTGVPIINHVRVPVLAAGLLFLLFFPGILKQGASSYADATGQTQEPFLERWLILSAVIFALSALAYGVRTTRTHHGPQSGTAGTTTQSRWPASKLKARQHSASSRKPG